ncbi:MULTISPECIES: hypothetical protein [Bradyrhizobium]|uniref:hypothetical protein n=1 Tax=Bradyrhizobium brasilense TaxID=1419277 RepID=UPI0028778776|nr:hypothetical protein [Bradyrhizobium brasilense]MCP3416187.1 hypothetical protein [Bradyrhizobium brasilense]
MNGEIAGGKLQAHGDSLALALSSEVESGSREENAQKNLVRVAHGGNDDVGKDIHRRKAFLGLAVPGCRRHHHKVEIATMTARY